MTPEMEAEHVELLKSGKADFVIVGDKKRCAKEGYTKKVIESYGYKQIFTSKYTSEGKYRRIVVVYKNKRLTGENASVTDDPMSISLIPNSRY
jgi:hypothetical protein